MAGSVFREGEKTTGAGVELGEPILEKVDVGVLGLAVEGEDPEVAGGNLLFVGVVVFADVAEIGDEVIGERCDCGGWNVALFGGEHQAEAGVAAGP